MKLCIISIGNDEQSKIYMKLKKKKCEELGIDCEIISFDENISKDIIIKKIDELNSNRSVTGIIVQLPLPNNYDAQEILNSVDEKKDVDGFTTNNLGRLLIGKPFVIPATPRGIMQILEDNKIELEGKHSVIIGRSNIVGKPIALLLLQKNCTVTICHSKTKDLAYFTRQADILVSSVGKKNLITKDMVKDGVVVIDVGKDIDYENVKPKCSFITPPFGSVGKMTIQSLIKNLEDFKHEDSFSYYE